VGQGKHGDHHNATDATYGDVVGIVHLDIDDQLHRDAKALAAQRGESLKALVTRAIETEVARATTEADKRRRT
jgi:predicted HicB family RNase H-like nuclease